MPTTDSLYLPEPKNWQDFQNLCRDLWGRIWNDSYIKINGREGFQQNGVDIYGIPDGKGKYAGIQCKIKDKNAGTKLTVLEVTEEVEKAKTFEPKLDQYIIATTGPRDGKLDELERKLTEEHLKKNLFTVHIMYWDDIVSKLSENEDLILKHFPVMANSVIRFAEQLSQSKQKYTGIIDSQILNSAIIIGEQKVEDINSIIVEGDGFKDELLKEYNNEVDHARDLIKNFNLIEGIALLESLKTRVWDKSNNMIKYRITTNLAAAKMQLDSYRKAGAHLIITALQYNQNDNNAILNAAIGYIELGDLSVARKLADKILSTDKNNVKAYAVKLQSLGRSDIIEDALKDIPENLRTKTEIALAIGNIAKKDKNLELAEKWFTIAMENNTENSIEFKGLLAETLLEIATKESFIINTKQIDELTNKRLQKALKLFDEANNLMSEKGLIKFFPTYIFNRGIIKQLLGDLNGAAKDMDEGIKLEPAYDSFIKHRAHLAHVMHDDEKAIKLLKGVAESTGKKEYFLMLAEIEANRNNFTDAEKLIEDLLNQKIDEKLKIEAYLLLARIYKRNSKYDQIEKIAFEIKEKHYKSLMSKIYLLRILRLLDDKQKITESVNEIEELIKSSANKRIRLIFADELYALGHFDQAAKHYSQVTNPMINNSLTYRLISCYYQSGDYKTTLALCQKLRETHGVIREITEIEIVIYERIGDLKLARNVCEEHLKKYPDDFNIKLRFAIVNFRAEKFESVDSFLAENFDVTMHAMDALFQIVFLYRERKLYLKSINLLYEIRRRFYSDPLAHTNYIAGLLFVEKELMSILKVEFVKIDSAVCIGSDRGDKDWYIIEDRMDVKLENRELYYDRDLAKKMIGKTIGDTFLQKVGMGKESELKVIALQSKYTYAYQQSFELLAKLFPNEPGLSIVPYKNDEEAVSDILNHISEFSEFTSKAHRFYKDGMLTIGAFSKIVNRNVIEVWLGFINNAEIGLKCCIGTTSERENALKMLSKNKILVLDLIAVLTIQYLEIENTLAKSFEILISQKVVDYLKAIQSEMRNVKSKGMINVYKINGGFRSNEIKPEDVKKDVLKIEKILSWIGTSCIVKPCKEALKINAKRKDKLDDLIGEEFLDSVLLAKEMGAVFYSDDERLRAFAHTEFKVEGVWTQSVLLFLLDNRKIVAEDFDKSSIKLISANYNYTSINARLLVEAAKQAQWQAQEPYNVVAKILSGRFSSVEQALLIALNFMHELLKYQLHDIQYDFLTIKLIDYLLDQREPKLILPYLKKAIIYRFSSFPWIQSRVLSIINNWELTH